MPDNNILVFTHREEVINKLNQLARERGFMVKQSSSFDLDDGVKLAREMGDPSPVIVVDDTSEGNLSENLTAALEGAGFGFIVPVNQNMDNGWEDNWLLQREPQHE